MTTETAALPRVRSTVNIEGEWITLGNKQYLMPALNLRGMRTHRETLQKMQQGRSFDEPVTDEYIDSVCKIFHCALARNYPELTEEEVLEGVDMRNLGALTFAVMGLSGFTVPAEGAAAPAEVATDAAGQPLIQAGELTGTA